MTTLLAAIELGFDPLLHIGALTIRWQTIGVTVALLIAFAVAALLVAARAAPSAAASGSPFPDAPPSGGAQPASLPRAAELRADHLLLILLGIVPGAVVGGRIVHMLTFFEAYAARPALLLDPAVGTLSLTGAVLGGTLSALYVAKLLGAPIRSWADVVAIPLLLALGIGKLAQLLGGSGQGLPFDGAWAVAFVGDGPWVSAAPGVPSHPAQIYEALWLLVGIPLVIAFAGPRRAPSRAHPYVAWLDRAGPAGRLFVGALAWFLAGRVLVGFVWRDPDVLGPLNVEQLLALALLAVGAAILLRERRRTAAVG